MLENKIVFVAGASGLIGRQLCKELLEQGAKVLAADIDMGEEINILQKQYFEKIIYVKLDVTQKDSIRDSIKKSEEYFGDLDACVNLTYPRNKTWGECFENLDYDDLSDNISMQLGGAIILAQQVIQHWREKSIKGNYVNISSIQGLGAPKFRHYEGTNMTSPIEYTAVKAGVIAMTKWMAKYYANKNIRINCISLGGILDKQPESFVKKYREDCLNKGMLDPHDICGTIIFLLSDLSEYINGQNIVIDDGWSL